MQVELITARELDSGVLSAWSRIRRDNAALHSPFFSPEFVLRCAAIHADVEIGIVLDAGKPAAFFPFHRVGRRTAQPLGKDLSDFHGLIAPASLPWSAPELLRGCKLDTWMFDHLLASQRQFAPYTTAVAESVYVDLQDGYAQYCRRKRESGSLLINRTGRAQRMIDRDTGKTHFQMLRDPSLVSHAMNWQQVNLRRRGTLFLHSPAEREEMYRAVLQSADPELNAWWAALYAGERLLACHLFLCSHTTAHWWLAAFDPSHPQNSPGIIAMLRGIEALAEMGITRVDLGKSSNELKERFRNNAELVAEGAVEVRPLVRAVRHAWRRAERWLWDSPLKSAAKQALRRWRTRHAPQVAEGSSSE
jgi:CelD/BcsL family acetyltransferase involved in cellulose biosynthesis